MSKAGEKDVNDGSPVKLDGNLEKIERLETEILKSVGEAVEAAQRELPPGTYRELAGDMDEIEGDVKRHLDVVKNLRSLCAGEETVAECIEKTPKTVSDLWSLVGRKTRH